MIIENASGRIIETQEAERNGQPVGRVSGLITTFVPNRPFDNRNLPKRFERTAFDDTIQRHRDRDNRPVRMLSEHFDLIGGFPIDMIHVNAEGLFGTGEINLNTQLGKETFALAQQGVLTDFSMGYNVVSEHLDNGDRIADSIELFEASITAEPANQGAKITSLESLTTRELEKALMLTGRFTRSMAKDIAAKILTAETVDSDEDALERFANSLKAHALKEEHELLDSLVSDVRQFTSELKL